MYKLAPKQKKKETFISKYSYFINLHHFSRIEFKCHVV